VVQAMVPSASKSTGGGNRLQRILRRRQLRELREVSVYLFVYCVTGCPALCCIIISIIDRFSISIEESAQLLTQCIN
jgi:hypothetical protein